MLDAQIALQKDQFARAHRIFSRISALQELHIEPQYCSPFKLQHDIEQMRYLLKKRKLPKKFKEDISRYTAGLALCRKIGTDFIPLIPSLKEYLGPNYGTLFHLFIPGKTEKFALNQRQDFAFIEQEYLALKNPIVVIDQVLSKASLRKLRKMILESAIWHDIKPNAHLGARLTYGLSSPLVFQIAAELKQKLPKVFAGLSLKQVWAFKYAPKNSGIETHSDGGLVNLNMWLTPDEDNIDPSTGGMAIYERRRPTSWTLNQANGYDNLSAVKRLVSQPKVKRIAVPYRFNRGVLFDSRLFHETDRFHFRDTYVGRRVNLTFLFDRD